MDDGSCDEHQKWTITLGEAFEPDILMVYFRNTGEEVIDPSAEKTSKYTLTVEISNYRNPPSSKYLISDWVASVRKEFEGVDYSTEAVNYYTDL